MMLNDFSLVFCFVYQSRFVPFSVLGPLIVVKRKAENLSQADTMTTRKKIKEA